MVHKLRRKNVCKSTPTTDQAIFGRYVFPRPRRPLGDRNAYLGATPLTRNPGENTDGILHSTAMQANICPNIENINNVETLALDFSEILENPSPVIAMVSPPAVNHIEEEPVPEMRRLPHNKTISFHNNICAAVDQIIFDDTFNRHGGISLQAVKKELNEKYGYNPTRFGKIPTEYVAKSIAEGKFRQISGRGASGKFRLNTNKHKQFIIQSRTIHKNKSKFQVTLLNRTKRQQLALLAANN